MIILLKHFGIAQTINIAPRPRSKITVYIRAALLDVWLDCLETRSEAWWGHGWPHATSWIFWFRKCTACACDRVNCHAMASWLGLQKCPERATEERCDLLWLAVAFDARVEARRMDAICPWDSAERCLHGTVVLARAKEDHFRAMLRD